MSAAISVLEGACDQVGARELISHCAWNSNLEAMAGQTICVTNPDGDFTVIENQRPDPVTVTTTAPIPSQTFAESNPRCGEWYQHVSGGDCNVMMMAFSITLVDL